jgi:feruloyl esterase
LAQCDAVDGVTDGIITNPRACTFNPDVLACPAGHDDDTCFTAPQLIALKKVLQGPQDSAGRQLFPPDEIGAETDSANWDTFVTGPGIRLTLGLFTYGRMLNNITTYDPTLFNFDTDPELMRAVLGPTINATQTDLRAQMAKGIKVIHYLGWSDAALSPQGSINYYNGVASAVGGIDKAQTFYKLYMVPGMVHCHNGPGPNDFGQYVYDPNGTPQDDIIKALEQWVEKGQAPDTITATKYATNDDINSAVVMKRPLCAYPKQQKYVGGDPNLATSFTCAP